MVSETLQLGEGARRALLLRSVYMSVTMSMSHPIGRRRPIGPKRAPLGPPRVPLGSPGVPRPPPPPPGTRFGPGPGQLDCETYHFQTPWAADYIPQCKKLAPPVPWPLMPRRSFVARKIGKTLGYEEGLALMDLLAKTSKGERVCQRYFQPVARPSSHIPPCHSTGPQVPSPHGAVWRGSLGYR